MAVKMLHTCIRVKNLEESLKETNLYLITKIQYCNKGSVALAI